jgi:hypothetical protein
MSLFGPVTDADRRVWQERAYLLLGELLKLGREKDLPLLCWQVSDAPTLLGEALGVDQGKRRAAFEAWVSALKLDRQPEVSSGSQVHLRAVTKDWGGRRVDVGVVADIWVEDEAEGG